MFDDARDAPSRLKDGLSQSISPALLAMTTARKAPVFTSTKALGRSPMQAERSQSLRGVAASHTRSQGAYRTIQRRCGTEQALLAHVRCLCGFEQQKTFKTNKLDPGTARRLLLDSSWGRTVARKQIIQILRGHDGGHRTDRMDSLPDECVYSACICCYTVSARSYPHCAHPRTPAYSAAPRTTHTLKTPQPATNSPRLIQPCNPALTTR